MPKQLTGRALLQQPEIGWGTFAEASSNVIVADLLPMLKGQARPAGQTVERTVRMRELSHDEYIAHEMARSKKCDCFGPVKGIGHAPICAYVRAMATAQEAWEDACNEAAIAQSGVPQ